MLKKPLRGEEVIFNYGFSNLRAECREKEEDRVKLGSEEG